MLMEGQLRGHHGQKDSSRPKNSGIIGAPVRLATPLFRNDDAETGPREAVILRGLPSWAELPAETPGWEAALFFGPSGRSP